jgi:hypothetical protein
VQQNSNGRLYSRRLFQDARRRDPHFTNSKDTQLTGWSRKTLRRRHTCAKVQDRIGENREPAITETFTEALLETYQ